ncbi:CsbD family protein [Methylobacterium sp. 10]|uniref:CsbD family protein n=1 Tax=Methylobacterium sp. 10 TaxID=1101191 RepID=UPI000481C286|nr:CsbD family protein [Methylobacterium sp. 10]
MVDTSRITGAANNLGGKAEAAIGDLVGSREHSVKGRVREAQGTAENLYGQAKDVVRNVADEVSDYAEDAYDHSKRQIHEVHERSTEWPHASLLVAGLVGFGLGLLVAKL